MPALLNDVSRASLLYLHRHTPKSPFALSRQLHPFTLWRTWHKIQLSSWGFHAYRFHDLRHTAITNYYIQTRDIWRTKLFARHLDLQTTQKYIHLAERPEMEADLNAITSAFQTSNILPFRIAK
jgi:integrase